MAVTSWRSSRSSVLTQLEACLQRIHYFSTSLCCWYLMPPHIKKCFRCIQVQEKGGGADINDTTCAVLKKVQLQIGRSYSSIKTLLEVTVYYLHWTCCILMPCSKLYDFNSLCRKCNVSSNVVWLGLSTGLHRNYWADLQGTWRMDIAWIREEALLQKGQIL